MKHHIITSRLLVLVGMASILCSGCMNRVPTIEFDEFMAMQRQQTPAEAELAPVDVETGESRVDLSLAPYTAGPGDVLSVTLSGLDVEIVSPVQVRVHGDGTVHMPLVKDVVVEGLTMEQIEDKIYSAYVPAQVRDLAVHVEIQSYKTADVIVHGAVTLPGRVPLPRHQRNVLYSVLAAGGVTNDASGIVSLKRIRRPNEDIVVDLTDPVDLEAALALDPLENGDIVEVMTAPPNVVFVGGLVNAPAPQYYPQGVQMSYLQVLAAAGGVRTDVRPRSGLLVRRMPCGNDVRVKLHLDRLADGKDENFMMMAGDILWVPETDMTKFHDFVNRSFSVRAGISAVYDPIRFEQTQRALRQNTSGQTLSRTINDSLRLGLQNTIIPGSVATP